MYFADPFIQMRETSRWDEACRYAERRNEIARDEGMFREPIKEDISDIWNRDFFEETVSLDIDEDSLVDVEEEKEEPSTDY